MFIIADKYHKEMREEIEYKVEDLESARKFLNNTDNKVVITNLCGATQCYGMLVVDYIFKTLKKEFPDKIKGIIVDANEYASFITAKQLGYNRILYTQ